MDGNTPFVSEFSTYVLSGEVISNFNIDSVIIDINHPDMAHPKSLIVNPNRATTNIRFRTTSQQASELPVGINTVTVTVNTAGKAVIAHSFDMLVGAPGEVNPDIRSAVIEFCNDPSKYSFRDYSLILENYQRDLDTWDMVCIAWSDYTGRARRFFSDLLNGNDKSTYQIELYEADIAEMLRDMYDQNNLPSVKVPDWCKELKNLAGEAGATVSIYKSEFINLVKNDTVLTPDYKIWKYDKIYK